MDSIDITSKSAIEIVSGHTSRQKLVSVAGVSPEQARRHMKSAS